MQKLSKTTAYSLLNTQAHQLRIATEGYAQENQCELVAARIAGVRMFIELYGTVTEATPFTDDEKENIAYRFGFHVIRVICREQRVIQEAVECGDINILIKHYQNHDAVRVAS